MAWNPDIETTTEETYRHLLYLAYDHAWNYSHDSETKTGALIIEPDSLEILACGANHFPNGTKPTEEQLKDRTWVRKNIMHAEPSVIEATLKTGKQTKDKNMVMPWVPCEGCAEAMSKAGIKKLISHKAMIMKTPEHWWDSCSKGINLLRDAGIEMVMYDGKINGIKGLFRGEVWYP